MDAGFWVRKLGLKKHPEGGYYRETYRSDIEIDAPAGKRSAGTAIYYMLERGQFSAFHRIRSDEIWHFYAGSPLVLYVIDKHGRLEKITLGRNMPQTVISRGGWFAAFTEGAYSLVGCTVAPGFDFRDLEMAKRKELALQYTQHGKIIARYTRQ